MEKMKRIIEKSEQIRVIVGEIELPPTDNN